MPVSSVCLRTRRVSESGFLTPTGYEAVYARMLEPQAEASGAFVSIEGWQPRSLR